MHPQYTGYAPCVCIQCTATFKAHRSHIARGWGKFCSRACKTAYVSTTGFWARVDRSGGPDACWPWLGPLNKYGYGKFGHTTAHRHAYTLGHGSIPTDALVRHAVCGNRACCNPAHLLIGTPADNAADTVAMGRASAGEGHGNVRLTEEQVREIRARYIPRKVSTCVLAAEYGVSQATVWAVIHRKVWRHVA